VPSQTILLPLKGELSRKRLRGCLLGAVASETAQRLNRRVGMGPSPEGRGNFNKTVLQGGYTAVLLFVRMSPISFVPPLGGVLLLDKVPAYGTMAVRGGMAPPPVPLPGGGTW